LKIKNPFLSLTRFEWGLYGISLAIVVLSFVFSPERDVLNLIASLVGVTALIFVARGAVFGQGLLVIFALLYAITSYREAYYGEMITYLGMSAPAAVMALISWLRHPYNGNKSEVTVNRISKKDVINMIWLSVVVTAIFYFILEYFNTANLYVSTVSITTSFMAVYLSYKRSPYYALAYASNDVVLIVLWVMAAISDRSCISVVICFSVFFVNDMYGFISWMRMRKRQAKT